MIKILPYSKKDGIPTMTDSAVMSFWDQMEADGTIGTVFCDGKIRSRAQWLENVKSEQTMFCIAVIDGNPVGLGWLNRMEKKRAFGHFCLFSSGWGERSAEIGKAMLNFFFDIKDRSGNLVFEVLIGFIPTLNRTAVAYAIECGAELVGTVPNVLWNEDRGECEPGTLVYFERPQ